LFERAVLKCHKRMQHERSIFAVYHLFTGKQSIQSIQDAQLFGLAPYYGIYINLQRERFAAIIRKLADDRLIMPQTKNNFYLLTEKGNERLIDNRPDQTYLAGSDYRSFDKTYFLRLLLLIQVWTNRKQKNNAYIPIVENEDVLHWAKGFYSKTKHDVEGNLLQLYEELRAILSLLPPLYPEIFLDQITNCDTIGLTKTQVAAKYNFSPEDAHLMTTSVIHLILRSIQANKKKFKLLCQIGNDLFLSETLTSSASKTKLLLEKGLSISEISNCRKLKRNTIYDHIVEIALADKSFDLSPYVPESVQSEIIRAIGKNPSFKLKSIKEAVDDTVSYFQIRLVLTKVVKQK